MCNCGTHIARGSPGGHPDRHMPNVSAYETQCSKILGGTQIQQSPHTPGLVEVVEVVVVAGVAAQRGATGLLES